MPADPADTQRHRYEPPVNDRMCARFFATRPTAFTRFLRILLPYQMWRFIAINVKMIRIIRRGH